MANYIITVQILTEERSKDQAIEEIEQDLEDDGYIYRIVNCKKEKEK